MYDVKIMNNEIEEKKKEIENYERILNAYRGRWYNMGKTHLESLYAELKALEEKGAEKPL